MLDRKLLAEALRIDNKDVLPKFGSSELKKIMEENTEYLNIDNLVNWEEGTLTEHAVFSILDALDRGSVGIADSDDQPSLNFIRRGDEIIAHNLFTDEDAILDATPEAIAEYIIDQLNETEFQKDLEKEESATAPENVLFKQEYTDYLDKYEILAVFVDCIEQAGDEGRVLVYSHEGQHSYADPAYIEALPDAAAPAYEPLKQELEAQGYVLNVLNDLPASTNEEAFQNYGVCIAKDLGNDCEILEIRDSYPDFDAAQNAISELETSSEFDDPTMMAFVVYSDGTSWFNAVTGDAIEYDANESINEDVSESFEVLEDVLEMCKDLPENLRERIIHVRSGKVSSKKELHDLMMDVRNAVEGKVPSSMYNRIDDAIDNLHDEINDTSAKNEDSEISKIAEDLMNYVENAMSNAQKNILRRIQYRFIDNVSYFGEEAERKAEAVKDHVKTALSNLADGIWESLG